MLVNLAAGPSLVGRPSAKRIMVRFCCSSHDSETKIITRRIAYYSIWHFLSLIPAICRLRRFARPRRCGIRFCSPGRPAVLRLLSRLRFARYASLGPSMEALRRHMRRNLNPTQIVAPVSLACPNAPLQECACALLTAQEFAARRHAYPDPWSRSKTSPIKIRCSRERRTKQQSY